ncbi:hypothetical protein EYC84_008425 [Monilinia fructicola]|uniref:Uncharacterized protein n=1 Tax=Monilinia fructicola TaxID=38448 RepID=A0A5M9JH61_MONFR|nr:hypothetical protein EYC84_008425 [Monilinia fructicola]
MADAAKIQELLAKPRNELTEFEVAQIEEHEFTSRTPLTSSSRCPFSRTSTDFLPVTIENYLRASKLSIVIVIWSWRIPVNKDRFISKMFLRGDSVILKRGPAKDQYQEIPDRISGASENKEKNKRDSIWALPRSMRIPNQLIAMNSSTP